MTNLSGCASSASDQSIIGNKACADAGAEGYVGHVSSALAEGDSVFGDGGGIGVVFEGDGEAEGLLDHISEGNGSELGEVGRIDEGSGYGVDGAGRGDTHGNCSIRTDFFQEFSVHLADGIDHGIGGLVGGGGSAGLGEDRCWGNGKGGAKGRATYVDAE